MSDPMDDSTRELLAMLDPEEGDPGYWLGFHRWVVTAAGPELARRRRTAVLTVADVMLSWWRALVPAALATAALAAIMLVRDDHVQPAAVAYVDVDEILMVGIEAPEMPAFEMDDPEVGIVLVNEIF